MNYNLTFAIKSNEYIFHKIINYYLPTKQDSIMETIRNNDTNVPPVEGLFPNGNAKGKIVYFICLLFFSYNDSEPFSFVFITKDNRKHLLHFVNCTPRPEGWRHIAILSNL